MNKTICIYHANCCDGMGAAWVVHQALNENADVEFIAASYQGELPDVKDAHVIIVDFSFKQDQMHELASEAASILVIDHHKTAQAELIPLIESGVIQGVFDMTQSGAMLTWNHFFPGQEPPALIRHIQDRDLWKFELPGTREIQAALYSYPMELDVWDKLMELDVQQLYQEGVAIDRAHLKNVRGLVEYCVFESFIAGYTVPTLNCNYMFASDAGNIMAEGVPFSATYQETDGYRKYSLRSVPNGGIDVAEVAAKFGGGGHRHAAGFKIALSELDLLNESKGFSYHGQP
ncbi:DHHA1 domain-containing protein [Vibrio vulnificus]|uniref:DHHA1 domain-containing protein n=1 Tax=Vibrio vulnificus TaxID=672 RepID=UPI003ED90CBE